MPSQPARLNDMSSLKKNIDPDRVPGHIAIIMDGNGRWAKQKGKLRVFGHKNGVTAVRESVEAAGEAGVKFVTFYAFSTENWNRPKKEVDALMELLVTALSKETESLNKNNIRLIAIGDLKSLPGKCYEELQEAMKKTAGNTAMTVILALSYSARWEITDAVKQIADRVKKGELEAENITEKDVAMHLCTAGIPDPELLIRTSGEQRVSNFLLWQIAYAELYFTEKLWPDFRKEDIFKAIIDYQKRERRFGKTSEQLIKA